MANLRQAAHELLGAWNAWQDSGAICADGRLLDALDALEQALADDEPSTDELLRRLQPGDTLMIQRKAGSPRDLTQVMLRHREPSCPRADVRTDTTAALRAVLLRLPAPTEPPEE